MVAGVLNPEPPPLGVELNPWGNSALWLLGVLVESGG